MQDPANQSMLDEYKIQNPFFPVMDLDSFEWEEETYFRLYIYPHLSYEFDALFEKYNKFGNGVDWEFCVIEMIKFYQPEIVIRELEFSSESSTFVLDCSTEEIQLKIAKLIHEVCKDQSELEKFIKNF